ncbi:UNVERIFIED_CONTAM: hypothetical protein H355_005930 [Colinus virginianus]|nr:hypothetical protein H355_005930 [Colinus virginianus]
MSSVTVMSGAESRSLEAGLILPLCLLPGLGDDEPRIGATLPSGIRPFICRVMTVGEMLQEKSLSETEEGFPTAPAPGHADSSAGSPVLGVAGGSSTPLSSPQLPDPEQVRTDRAVEQTGTAAHRVLTGRGSRLCSC